MQFLTDFGDEAVVLPVFALAAVSMLISGWYRGLAAWLFAVGGALGTIGLLKYIFYVCYSVLDVTGIHSPSGHTGATAAVYGGGLLLLLRGRVKTVWLVVIPVALAALIGFSRVEVGAHVPVESVVGGAVGLLGAALLVVLAGPRPPMRAWPIASAAAVTILLFHGIRFNAETILHHFVLFTWLPLPAACHA